VLSAVWGRAGRAYFAALPAAAPPKALPALAMIALALMAVAVGIVDAIRGDAPFALSLLGALVCLASTAIFGAAAAGCFSRAHRAEIAG
jgi:hypothetical protein